MESAHRAEPLLTIRRMSCRPLCTHTALHWLPNKLSDSQAHIVTDRWKCYSGVMAKEEITLKGLSSVFHGHVFFLFFFLFPALT